ncbi:MAG: 4Fe-4S binding protein [Chloroflexota bacterium]
MANRDITRHKVSPLYILPPLISMIVLWAIGIVYWYQHHDALALIGFGYVGLFIGAGIGGYVAASDRYRPYARRLVILLLGSFLLLVAFVTDHGNMQMEGFFFALFAGSGSYILIHFAIAKIIGPLVFGRIWCGWACWYGMIFDLLPYPFSHYRQPKKWGWLRYIHLLLSFLVVVVLWFGFGMTATGGVSGILWFTAGVMLYYAVGITMAFALKDNRAFCKYLCPLAVPLKFSSRFSLLKVAGKPDHCADCEVCVEMCPMDIRVKDYIGQGERVLSTECTLCQTCITACPHDSLTVTLGLDIGGKEYTDYDPSRGNRISQSE